MVVNRLPFAARRDPSEVTRKWSKDSERSGARE